MILYLPIVLFIQDFNLPLDILLILFHLLAHLKLTLIYPFLNRSGIALKPHTILIPLNPHFILELLLIDRGLGLGQTTQFITQYGHRI